MKEIYFVKLHFNSFGGLAMNKKDRDKVKLREVVHRQLRYIDWVSAILN